MWDLEDYYWCEMDGDWEEAEYIRQKKIEELIEEEEYWNSRFERIDEQFEESLEFDFCSCWDGWLCDVCEFTLNEEIEKNAQTFEDECYEIEMSFCK